LDIAPELEIHPGTFSVVIAPASLMAAVVQNSVAPKRFLVLFICGNYSRLLNRISDRSAEMDIRRAFTAFQMLNILGQASHSVIFIEHDPTIYEDFDGPVELIAGAMREAATGCTAVVLYSPAPDQFLNEISRTAHRVFCMCQDDGSTPRRSSKRAALGRYRRYPEYEVSGDQTTLEVF